MASQFTDIDGRHPQHTFFFPLEEYRAEFLDLLAVLCRRGFGEVEVHLHHDNDTAKNLRDRLRWFTRTLHDRHGLLSLDASGRIRYAFIHGNWALDNSLPDLKWCGVDGELKVLCDTGCHADFTLPSAPSPAQTRIVNQIYYATCASQTRKGHDRGVRASVGKPPPPDGLLMVQGPLALSWRRAKWRVLPRLENSSLFAGHPPTISRFADWLSCGISVAGRPEWVFVKVHTHGAPEANASMLLGSQVTSFHRELQASFNDGERYRLHYVTAREMTNIVHAAEDGRSGHPAQFRDLAPAPDRDPQLPTPGVSRS
jgi:hypothetical protein